MLIYDTSYLKVISSQFLFNIRDEKGRYIHLYENKNICSNTPNSNVT